MNEIKQIKESSPLSSLEDIQADIMKQNESHSKSVESINEIK